MTPARIAETLDTFTPPPVDQPVWATFIPGRTTKTKFAMHQTIGHAKNAFDGCSKAGILYELVNGKWTERFRQSEHQAKHRTCMWCGTERKWGLKAIWNRLGDGSIKVAFECDGYQKKDCRP